MVTWCERRAQSENNNHIAKVRLLPSKKNCFVSSDESPLKMMKNVFYFILKAFFYSQDI